jgi:hypothetical protein
VRLQKLGNLWFESTSVKPLRVNAEKECLDSFSLFLLLFYHICFTSFAAFVQPTLPSFFTDVTGGSFFSNRSVKHQRAVRKKPALRLFTFFFIFLLSSKSL